MVKSMTGYGVWNGKIGPKRISIETKSVNHKFCEVNLRIFPRYSSLEGPIVEFAKSYFNRGRVDIFIRDQSGIEGHAPAKIDTDRLKEYHQKLKRVAKNLNLDSKINLDTLLSLPQVVVPEEEEDLEKFWRKLRVGIKSAFDSLEKMRNKEGKSIGIFLEKQIRVMLKEIKSIEILVPKNVKIHQGNLEERIRKLASSVEFDEQRLAQEIAYFVDRTDISEELQRLKQHIKHFGEVLKEKVPLGRKLDFLLQEMNREVNTLSSKAQNATISGHVVECKHALEKMREQVQNVE